MFDRQAFIDNLIDYYQSPRNKGRLDDATVTVSGGNPGCGDVVTMHVKVEDGIAKKIRFEGQGCTISQAGASMVAEKYEGQPLEEIESASTDDMIDEMGRDVVTSRIRCATVGIGTLKGAVQQYRKDQILGELERERARERERATDLNGARSA
ncbi:MAG: iron-sulfur cluster assembly scaffold protein [Chloroflexi bacterium]|nr:iron-sulfur cluster assembly scaffold protein [Chloroflexota bacterium]